MLDAAPIAHQRSRGIARVSIGGDGRIVDLFQQGSAKAMMPAVHGDVPEVVFLNTSGGLTGGDRLSFEMSVADGGALVAATQTAERVYASSGGAAHAEVRISVGAGATCCWLPQETIVFDHGALDRETLVALGEGARFLGLETLVLGREAMGETVARGSVSDVRRVTRAGRLVHAEQIGLDDPLFQGDFGAAGLDDARVVASLVYLADDAEDHLAAVRRVLGDTAAASAWRGRLVVRMIDQDSWAVRQVMARVVSHLAGHVPRVWQM